MGCMSSPPPVEAVNADPRRWVAAAKAWSQQQDKLVSLLFTERII